MKFTIELEDFWMDEDSDYLQGELVKSITRKIVTKIEESIKAKIDDQIIRGVKNMIEKSMYKKADKYIDECFETATFKARVYEDGRNVDKTLTLGEYVANEFKSNSGWASPSKKIEKLAEQFSVELKDRYDLMFASQIVAKLNDQGMLKKDVAKMLLEEN